MNVECVASENQTLLIQYLLAPELIGLQPVLMKITLKLYLGCHCRLDPQSMLEPSAN